MSTCTAAGLDHLPCLTLPFCHHLIMLIGTQVLANCIQPTAHAVYSNLGKVFKWENLHFSGPQGAELNIISVHAKQ